MITIKLQHSLTRTGSINYGKQVMARLLKAEQTAVLPSTVEVIANQLYNEVMNNRAYLDAVVLDRLLTRLASVIEQESTGERHSNDDDSEQDDDGTRADERDDRYALNSARRCA